MSEGPKFYKLEIGKRINLKFIGELHEMKNKIVHCVACKLIVYENEAVNFSVSCWKEGLPYQAIISTHQHCQEKGCEIACLIDKYMLPYSYIKKLNDGSTRFESLGDIVLPEWEIEKYDVRVRGLGELLLYKIRENIYPLINCAVAGISLPLLTYFFILLPIQWMFLSNPKYENISKYLVDGLYHSMFILTPVIFSAYILFNMMWKNRQKKYYRELNRHLSLQEQRGENKSE